MIDKTFTSCGEAVASIFDGATILVGGFGVSGIPGQLLAALRQRGVSNLVAVHNGAGGAEDIGIAGLMRDGLVRKLIASFPSRGARAFKERYLKGDIELELVPQGTLAERIRAAGAGIGGFFTPTGAGTELAKGKETRTINGREYVFEEPLHADFALIKAHRADRLGNLSYRMVMRNFNLVMATAAKMVIAEVDEMVPVGELTPEAIHTPGIFVDRVVQVEREPRFFQPQKEGSAQ